MNRSRVVKRTVVVGHHKTSVSIEDEFWKELKAIARDQHMTLMKLIETIDLAREHGNLSSALRLFVLDHCNQRPPP